MVTKIKKSKVQDKLSKEKLKLQKNPLSHPSPKNFRHGNDIRPRIIKSQFMKFPRYAQLQRQKKILMKRKKCSPSLAKFFEPLNKDNFKKIFRIIENYSSESKKEKKERFQKRSKRKNERRQKKEGEKSIYLKSGFNHITYLIEQKRAKFVLIATDVDPIETVVFLLSLCKTINFLCYYIF